MTDDSEMYNDQAVQDAAKNLFVGCAPERHAELEELWKEYSPEFQFINEPGTESPCILEGGLYRFVRFDHLATKLFWFAAFIAWEGYCSFSKSTSNDDIDLTRFRSMVEAFQAMLDAENLEDVPLPAGVPEPGHYMDVEGDVEARAAAELATIATGWTFLHEIKHVQHQQDGTSAGHDGTPERKRAEELSCDTYATRFLLERVDAYASQSGEPEDKVRMKRELGAYFALFAMTLIGADAWDQTESHPAMQTRIDRQIREMGTAGTRLSDAIAHAAFAALWTIYPDAPGPFQASQAPPTQDG